MVTNYKWKPIGQVERFLSGKVLQITALLADL